MSAMTAILGANGQRRQSRDQARDHEIGELDVIVTQKRTAGAGGGPAVPQVNRPGGCRFRGTPLN